MSAEDIMKPIEALTKVIADGQAMVVEAQKKATDAAVEASSATKMNQAMRKKIEMKNMKIGEFEGENGKWDEWAFNFVSAIRAQSPEIYKHMVIVEEMKDDFDEDTIEDPRLEALSGELYDILAQICRGKA